LPNTYGVSAPAYGPLAEDPSKLVMRVRFPSPAPAAQRHISNFLGCPSGGACPLWVALAWVLILNLPPITSAIWLGARGQAGRRARCVPDRTANRGETRRTATRS